MSGLRLFRWLVVALAACIVAAPTAAHPDIEVQIQDLTQRIASDPTNADLYMRRGDLYRVHEDFLAAAADYDRARTLDPNLRLLDFAVGKMRLEDGRFQDAIEDLNRFLAKVGDDAEGLALRGSAYLALGNNAAAAADFGRAIERGRRDGNPAPPELYLERARALSASGEKGREEALRGLEEGLKLLVGPITLELAALDTEIALKRFDAALSRVDRLARASVRQEGWLVRRGDILEKAGRLTESKTAYTSALDLIAALPPARRTASAMDMEREARTGLDRVLEASERGGRR